MISPDRAKPASWTVIFAMRRGRWGTTVVWCRAVLTKVTGGCRIRTGVRGIQALHTASS